MPLLGKPEKAGQRLSQARPRLAKRLTAGAHPHFPAEPIYPTLLSQGHGLPGGLGCPRRF